MAPKKPAPNGTDAGLPAGSRELSQALSFWRDLERQRRRCEPAALPPDAVAALQDLVAGLGLARAMAVLRIYRRRDRRWSEWAEANGYPLGRLADPPFLERLMNDDAFPAMLRTYSHQLAADAMRRLTTAGQLFAGIAPRPNNTS